MVIEAKRIPSETFKLKWIESYGIKRMVTIQENQGEIYFTCGKFSATAGQLLILGDTAVGTCEKQIARKYHISLGIVRNSKVKVKLINYPSNGEGNLQDITKVVVDFERLGLLSENFQTYIMKNYHPFQKEKPQSK